jgi:hypothetical protein
MTGWQVDEQPLDLAREIEEADAIGDPSLLRDGLTHRDRIALETYQKDNDVLLIISLDGVRR